jgi:hypothetical protein
MAGNIKIYFGVIGYVGMHWNELVHDRVRSGTDVHSSILSVLVKGDEFLDQLRDYSLLG